MLVTTDLAKNFKPIEESNGKWYVCWDYEPVMTSKEKIENNKVYIEWVPSNMATWRYFVLNHKPVISEIQKIIFEYIDGETSKRIINTFSWRDYKVYLSTINQSNYKTAYDLAVQTNGNSLPVKFKFSKDGKTAYYTFENLDELTDFYTNMVKHINTCLSNGWDRKDSIIFDDYKI